MMKRMALTILMACAIAGCAYSQKNFDRIGQAADRGEYGMVVYGATVGVFISGIVDIVSLGGTLSPDEAQETWSTAAEQYSAQRTTENSNSTNSAPITTSPSYNSVGGEVGSPGTGNCYGHKIDSCYDPDAVYRIPKQTPTNSPAPSETGSSYNRGAQ